MSEIKKQWYVVRAIGGKENKVKEYIEARFATTTWRITYLRY